MARPRGRAPFAVPAPPVRHPGSTTSGVSGALGVLGAIGMLLAALPGTARAQEAPPAGPPAITAPAAATPAPAAAPAAPVVTNPTVESLQELGLMSSLLKAAMEGAYGLLAVYQKNLWISGVLTGCIMVYVGWRVRQVRLERAQRGDPLSNQKG